MTTAVIDHAATDYSIGHALCMARAADLAYKDEQTVETTAREWGFDRVRHHHTLFRPPFPLEDTQAYTIASSQMIITAFRGTQPVEMRDWLSDTTSPPWPGPGRTGFIHYGFGEALDGAWEQIRGAIDEFRDNDQSLWFTGHSLGGALAMLAAARLHFEEPNLTADGVYTFGQPRTCDRTLARAYDGAFTKRMYRFVNNNDVVPQLPPEPVFHHVDALRHIDSGGTVRDKMPVVGGLLDRVKGATADMLAPASAGVRDHLMTKYIAALEKNQR